MYEGNLLGDSFASAKRGLLLSRFVGISDTTTVKLVALWKHTSLTSRSDEWPACDLYSTAQVFKNSRLSFRRGCCWRPLSY